MMKGNKMRKLILPATMILLMFLAGCGSMGSNTVKSEFEEALLQKDSATVQRLLQEHKIDPNARHSHGCPMLNVAVEQKDTLSVQLLLEHGANVNSATAVDGGAMDPALIPAAYTNNIEIIELLLKHGADPRIKGYQNNTALHSVKSKQAAELLLAKGADVQAKDKYGRTPFQRLSNTNLDYINHNALFELMKFLVAHGASVNDYDDEGNTPLHLAAEKGHADFILFLIEIGADINAKDREGSTPLLLAMKNKRHEVALVLISKNAEINAEDRDKRTALHYAEEQQAYAVIRALLDKGADPNARDFQGRSPRGYAIAMQKSEADRKAYQASEADYSRRKDEAIARMKQDAIEQDNRAARLQREAAKNQPSIWELNAEASAKALKDAEAHHRRVTDPNYGTGCNSSVYGCR
jgi:ankyrin repeat protein